MTRAAPWLTDGADPVPQLLAEAAELNGNAPGPVATSQWTALARWPEFARAGADATLVLRRRAYEDEAEWSEALAILKAMLDAASPVPRLVALTAEAAAALSAELGRDVSVAPPLPRFGPAEKRLGIGREGAALTLSRGASGALPAGRFNLARLRRLAVLEPAADADPDLRDIAAYANGAAGVPLPPRGTPPVVVMVVPNGTGLGHVTRMLAVARHLVEVRGARVVFWSFSRAAGILARFGHAVILRQTAQHLGADPAAWRKWEAEEFAATLAGLQPELVVQDASAVQGFVLDALARPGTGAARVALVRRGMWQKHILGDDRLTSEDRADLVIEPGDLASAADRGVTRGRATQSGGLARMALSAPVTLTRPEEVLDRRRARKALGLGRGRYCLVSLGGDETGDRGPLVRHVVEEAARARVRLFWARSPLAGMDPALDGSPNVLGASVYPVAPYLSAFDGVVTAAGYNSFHEAMLLYRGPVLLVPGTGVRLDDQAARAGHAAASGWARLATDGADARGAVTAFMGDVRAGLTVTGRPDWRDGAAEIADAMWDLVECGARQG